jgi:hypothetical protein
MMRTHIKVVALLNIVLGLLGALAGLGVVLGGTLGSVMSGSLIGAITGSIVSALIGMCIAALSLIGMVAGFGLLNGRSWARYVIIVLSVLRLFRFPWMTIFGAYSLWVLFNSDAQREFNSPVV